MSLQIARAGIDVLSEGELVSGRDHFAAHQSIRVPDFFAPPLYAWIRDRVAAAPFVPQVHADVAGQPRNRQLADASLHLRLWTLLNDIRLFRTIEQLTGCGPIGCCVTHVYSLDATPESGDAWHGDVDGNRLIALSVNVGGRYEGGTLQIRRTGSRQVIEEIANTRENGAVLFRIGDDLEHFVTPVTAGRRVALAGWFQRRPSARALLGIRHPLDP